MAAEKEIVQQVKLQIDAGKATTAPPVGPALGSTGINIMQFVKDFNEKTASQAGMKIPVVVNIYKDKSFTYITKVPPMANLIKVAELKMPDLNANSIEAAMSIVEGTARSMGIIVED